MLADLQTPVGIYLKVRDHYPNSVLLESSDYHGGENSFSVIAFDPVASVTVQDGMVSMVFPDESRENRRVSDEVKVPEMMQQFMSGFYLAESETMPPVNG